MILFSVYAISFSLRASRLTNPQFSGPVITLFIVRRNSSLRALSKNAHLILGPNLADGLLLPSY